MKIAGLTSFRIASLSVTADLTRTELDSHADTCVVGDTTALITHDFNCPIRVHGYDSKVSEKDHCKSVTAVIAYNHPSTGDAYMVWVHQAILIPTIKHNLLYPNQLRLNDVSMNDEPKSMVPTPTDHHNAISINLEENAELLIPLSLEGVVLYFPTRKPTQQEYDDTPDNLCVDLTYDSPEWNPRETGLQQQEEQLLDKDGGLRDVTHHRKKMIASLYMSRDVNQEPERF